jgi:cellulose synthase operon protein C
MKATSSSQNRCFALLLASCVVLAACGGKSDADMVKAAKANLQANKPKEALIELKGALQKNPNSGEARYLLGQMLLNAGDAVAAQVELQKAAELRYNIVLVVPLLAKSLLDQGEHKKVVETYEKFLLPDAQAQAELRTTVANAMARQGAREPAQKMVELALKDAPKLATALVLQARLAADQRDFDGANKILDELLAREANNGDAWLLKGDIELYGKTDRKAALAAYRKAVEHSRRPIGAYSNIIEILLAEKDIPGATTEVAAMKKALPNQTQTLYFEGVLAYLNKDYPAARELSAKLVQAAPANALALQLAGAAEYQLRSLPQAETYLSKALVQAPGLALARQLLAQVQLRTGQPTKALETLAPLLDQPKVSGEVLAVAAEAHLANGDAKKSEELFTRATKAKPDDPRIRTAKALGQMRRGDTDTALSDLESVASSDKGVVADMALVSAHLRRNELDKALAAIAALEKKQPDKPVAANLRGRVQVLKKDTAGARQSFEKALAIDRAYYPAMASLAALDMVENKPAEARKRFEAFIKEQPRNVSALMGLANLLSRNGAPKQEVADVLTRAVKADPTQATARLRLVEHHLTFRENKEALAAATDGVAALPNHGDMLQALGRVQLVSGDLQQAVTTLSKLVASKPDSPAAHLALGEAYMARKDSDAADKSFKKALAIRNDLLPAQRALIAVALDGKRYPEALELARSVQKQRATEGIGFALEGDIEAHRRNVDAAVAAYRTALQKSRSSETAIRLHSLLRAAGRLPDAEKFAAAWEKDNPKDAAFLFARADAALSQRDFTLAETRYRAVLEQQPSNALALNNVAWLLVQQNKPGALEYIQKAVTLLPNQPALLDTWALALAADKKLPQAVETQKKALALAPEDNGLRFNLAKLLVQSGDKSQARIELQMLEKLGTRFPEHQKVSEMLKAVNS